MRKMFHCILIIISFTTTSNAVFGQQCPFTSLADFPANPVYRIMNDGPQDFCDSGLIPGNASVQFDVRRIDISNPTTTDSSLNFTIFFGGPFSLNPNDVNRFVGFIYIDTDQTHTTGFPLGDSSNYIPCKDISQSTLIETQISRLGADYCIDLVTADSMDASGSLLLPVRQLIPNSSCHGTFNQAQNSSNQLIFARLTSVDNTTIRITIEDLSELPTCVTGAVDFSCVFGYASTFGAAPDPTNPSTYAAVEIVRDNQNTQAGVFGRNRDTGSLGSCSSGDGSGMTTVIAKQGFSQFSTTANLAVLPDTLIYLPIEIKNGIPLDSLSFELRSTPNIFPAIVDSFRAVTERAFGFEIELNQGGSTLITSLKPKVLLSDTSIVPRIARGIGPVGLIPLDPFKLKQILDSTGETVINIQGSNVNFYSRDSVADYFADWSAFNNIDASIIKPKTPDPTLVSCDDIRVVPNPMRVGDPWIRFVNLPSTVAKINIYTERGDLIKNIPHTAGRLIEQWDLIMDSGQLCATGVYIASFETPQGQCFRKFVILR